MRPLDKEEFVCIDCETTGLDLENDHIIEVAVAHFSLEGIRAQFTTLVNPPIPIPADSMAIHHITDEMVASAPSIDQVLKEVHQWVGNRIVVGHGVGFDLQILERSAQRVQQPLSFTHAPVFDTLRLARLYGQSPVNSLESLRQHFNVPEEGAHRALNDVLVNIAVFKKLVHTFKTIQEVVAALDKPILMKTIPLGKYKGRLFKEVPENYLQWAAKQAFDKDLLFSIRSELKRRQKTVDFAKASNPFSSL